MSENSQIIRLVHILQYLSIGQKLSTTSLLDKFNNKISRRTLQRDFIALSGAGIPIHSEKLQGNENIWYLDTRFKNFIPIPIGINEYLAAHTLKENLKIFRNTVLEEDIESLFSKIEQIVPSNVFLDSRKGLAESYFEQYSAGLFDYSPYNEIIENIIKAIIERKVCKVSYFKPSSDSMKSYNIEPVKIVNYNGGLYTIAYIQRHHSYIMLAVQRIQSIKILEKPQGQNHTFNEDEFWQGKFGLFPGEQKEVKLQFSKSIKHHLEGRQWHASQSFNQEDDGSLILTMNVGLSPELITWISGWQEEVKVLKPLKLRKLIIDHLEKTIKLYS
ncbi:MAG: WYL domain-containing transcriptional regulator [Candidatus Marinimicrobia bacterium]|nr:WYL domain-containing transcriptional regulator [Candidatus Neomarinimicrobiota bacterium]